MENLNQLVEKALAAINTASNNQVLEDIRVEYLGKKGTITSQLKQLGTLPTEQRR